MNYQLLFLQVFNGVYLTTAVVVILFIFVFSMMRRYKRCPSDRILLVYGKTGGGQSANVFMEELPLYGRLFRIMNF